MELCGHNVFFALSLFYAFKSPQRTTHDMIYLGAEVGLPALFALGPEFTFQLALGQWQSARQSVRDFHASKFPDWTMKNAFYAESGGFLLRTFIFKPIPIDARQLFT